MHNITKAPGEDVIKYIKIQESTYRSSKLVPTLYATSVASSGEQHKKTNNTKLHEITELTLLN